jgi:hypothetical protein
MKISLSSLCNNTSGEIFFYLHCEAGGIDDEGFPCFAHLPATQTQTSSFPLAISNRNPSSAVNTIADKTFCKRLKFFIYFFPAFDAKSQSTPPISKTRPNTKIYGIKVGRKYRTKRAIPAPETECESACGFVHSLIILFNQITPLV